MCIRDSYGDLADFAPITATEGDCYARVKVRCLEVLQSIEIIKEPVSYTHLPPASCRTRSARPSSSP